MRALLFVVVFLAIGILIAAIPTAILGWCVWRLTKGLPFWLRLQIIVIPATLLAAISCTPFGGGEGGVMLPLGLILTLHFSDFFGVGGADLRGHVSQQAIAFLCVWGGMYFISMVAICIYNFIKKGRSRNVAYPIGL
jgi:hypothetical protein